MLTSRSTKGIEFALGYPSPSPGDNLDRRVFRATKTDTCSRRLIVWVVSGWKDEDGDSGGGRGRAPGTRVGWGKR